MKSGLVHRIENEVGVSTQKIEHEEMYKVLDEEVRLKYKKENRKDDYLKWKNGQK